MHAVPSSWGRSGGAGRVNDRSSRLPDGAPERSHGSCQRHPLVVGRRVRTGASRLAGSCKLVWALVAVASLGSVGTGAAPRWVGGVDVPVERLLENLSRAVRDDPSNAHVRYLLGRVHGLAFALGAREIALWGGRDPDLSDPSRIEIAQQVYQEGGESEPEPEASLEHLELAVRHLARAVELEPGEALYRLGLAYVLEHGAHLASHVDASALWASLPPLDRDDEARYRARIAELDGEDTAARAAAFALLIADLDEAVPVVDAHCAAASRRQQAEVRELLDLYWRTTAIDHYYEAFRLAHPQDVEAGSLDRSPRWEGLRRLVSFEAGEGFLRIQGELGGPAEGSQQVLAVREGMEELKRLDLPKWVTPIVFGGDGTQRLADLVDERNAVVFDLDGDGRLEAWTWLKAGTRLLVWDPDEDGRIEDGTQLFGTSTWWMFFRDGYEALGVLDDDGDGWLRGAELRGLSVWDDADVDGVSSRGEVVSLEAAGIASVAAHSTGSTDGTLWHELGVLTSDGRCLPTFDWVASTPAAPPRAR